jgi:hypothetical protein
MHLEAISSKRQKIFQEFKNFSKFYVAGGTALALHIGHRMSDDFDLFTAEDISASLIKKD